MPEVGQAAGEGISEPEAAPPRTARAWRLTRRRVVGLLALVCVLVVLDWYLANREMRSLLDQVEESEAAMVAYHTRSSNSRAQLGPTPDADEIQEVVTAVQSAASDAHTDVLIAHDEVEDVFILPWHFSLSAARDSYLAHNVAWSDYLDSIQDDPAEAARAQPEITSTFTTAERRFRDAMRVFTLFDSEQRVEALFKD